MGEREEKRVGLLWGEREDYGTSRDDDDVFAPGVGGEIRASLVSIVSSDIHIDEDVDDDDGVIPGVTGDLRLPWIWVEGWRARLRMGGDVVEKSRWEWRMDDKPGVRVVNNVPIIVATTPGLKGVLGVGGGVDGAARETRRKSVRWA